MRNLLFLFVLLILPGFAAGDQAKYYSFYRVIQEGRFVNSQVTAICEDASGFIWFGTKNGLFRYNSKEVEEFRHLRGDSSSIPSNWITGIHKDSSGKLWVSTTEGLCTYNQERRNFDFVAIRDKSGRSIDVRNMQLIEEKKGAFWFTNGTEIGKFDAKSKIATRITIEGKQSAVSRIEGDSLNGLWVFFSDGEVYHRKNENQTFSFFAKIPDFLINSVLIDGEDIWVSFVQNGLICLGIDGKIKHSYSEGNVDKRKKLPHDYTRNIIKTTEGNIWVATYEGIAVIEDYDINYVITKENHPLIPHHSIWTLFEDSQQNIWVGTWQGGLCFHSKYNSTIDHYDVSSSRTSISDNNVTCIAEIPGTDQLLIGTEGGGINIFDPQSRSFQQLPLQDEGLEVNNIKCMSYAMDGTLWVGTHGHGVFFRKKGETRFNKLKLPFQEGIQAFNLLVTEGGIWVCNYPEGVYFYDFSNKTFKNYRHEASDEASISDNYVRYIYRDKLQNLWFATERGLNLLTPGSSEFKKFFHTPDSNSISSDYIYNICEDEQGNLWLGTKGQGLDKLNINTLEVENYSLREGVTGDEVLSMVRDAEGNIWLATNNGLCTFDPQTKQTKKYSDKVFVIRRFMPSSAFTQNGEVLYFGGSNGLLRFAPQDIRENPVLPRPILTDLIINNDLILPGDPDGILTKLVSATNSIRLSYRQNDIGIKFTSNNYVDPERNQFRYRLEGFAANWIESEGNNRADFYNLPPGNYTFELKARNNSGVWNDQPVRLFIRITPPFWFSTYAYFMYFMLIIFIIYWYRQQIINRQQLLAEVQIEKVKNKASEEIHQSKMQFFTNISHEFRTPLSLIQGPLEQLKKKNPSGSDAEFLLNLISKNTKRLLSLTNQFLDFRKIESGELKLKTEKVEIVSFCREIFSCFVEEARAQNINFGFYTTEKTLFMDCDPEKMDKILFNLLSNAFKHTPEGGEIKLELNYPADPYLSDDPNIFVLGEACTQPCVEIKVVDSGIGISSEILPRIFDRFFIGEQNNKGGTGIGLAITKSYVLLHGGQLCVRTCQKTGSVFSLLLPLKQQENIDLKVIVEKQSSSQQRMDSEQQTLAFDPSNLKNKASLVLIVEDNRELQFFLERILSKYYKVIRANNGEVALEMAHSFFPDLIVSDIMMPFLDGIELCEKLKTDIRTSHIPIVLLTALDSVKDRIKGLSSGADAYVAKPFDENLLLVQIHNLLKSREELRDLYLSSEEQPTASPTENSLDADFLNRAVNITRQNLLREDFSVEELAEKLKISRVHLHRKLKKLTNQSATEFIRYIRLKHAVSLIKEGNHQINEIAYACGFNSHSYFTKSFRKQYGMSPGEFIKKLDSGES